MFIFHPFWGLEYEDSYIYSTVSRAININYNFGYDGLYTKYEVFGSLISGSETSTISGHFIFFSLLLSVVNRLVGFHAENVLIVNSLLSLITVYYSLKIFYLINISKYSLFGFGMVFSTTPFVCVYNTSGLSETFSSVFVVISIYYAFKSKKENYTKLSSIAAYGFFICLSVFIKRDNLVLISIPLLEILYAFYLKKGKQFKTKLLFIALFIFICIVVSNMVFNINRTVQDEMSDIGQNPFSFNFLKVIFPVFIKSLIKIQFFSLVGLLFLVSVVFIRKINSYLLLLLLICIGYLLVYSMHYRSYYMVHGNFIPNTIDTFRYFTNFFSVLSIFSFGLISIGLRKLMRNQKMIFYFLLFAFITLNIYLTALLRQDLSTIEYEERFLPM
ncbi:MAG: hypothetical protein ABI760_11835 [Ferruginibacter sp.]